MPRLDPAHACTPHPPGLVAPTWVRSERTALWSVMFRLAASAPPSLAASPHPSTRRTLRLSLAWKRMTLLPPHACASGRQRDLAWAASAATPALLLARVKMAKPRTAKVHRLTVDDWLCSCRSNPSRKMSFMHGSRLHGALSPTCYNEKKHTGVLVIRSMAIYLFLPACNLGQVQS